MHNNKYKYLHNDLIKYEGYSNLSKLYICHRKQKDYNCSDLWKGLIYSLI